MDVCGYPHPANHNVVLYDVPGLDAVQHTREKYLDVINFNEHKYDLFFIITKDVFSSDAKFIADLALELNKMFVLVRTHVDLSIISEQEDNPDMQPHEIVEEIRSNVEGELQTLGFDTNVYKVYLVNNRNPLEFDFPQLLNHLCKIGKSEALQEALLLTLGGYASQMIENKYEHFLERLDKIALASAAGGQEFLAGLGSSIDPAILVQEVLTYISGFGLTKDAISALEQLYEVPPGTIENQVYELMKSKYCLILQMRNKCPGDLVSDETFEDVTKQILGSSKSVLVRQVSLLGARNGTDKVAQVMYPCLGMNYKGCTSFLTSKDQLQQLLEEAKDLAIFINYFLARSGRRRLSFECNASVFLRNGRR